eukprot:IDg14852t1
MLRFCARCGSNAEQAVLKAPARSKHYCGRATRPLMMTVTDGLYRRALVTISIRRTANALRTGVITECSTRHEKNPPVRKAGQGMLRARTCCTNVAVRARCAALRTAARRTAAHHAAVSLCSARGIACNALVTRCECSGRLDLRAHAPVDTSGCRLVLGHRRPPLSNVGVRRKRTSTTWHALPSSASLRLAHARFRVRSSALLRLLRIHAHEDAVHALSKALWECIDVDRAVYSISQQQFTSKCCPFVNSCRVEVCAIDKRIDHSVHHDNLPSNGAIRRCFVFNGT